MTSIAEELKDAIEREAKDRFPGKEINVSILPVDDPRNMNKVLSEEYERGIILGYKAALHTFGTVFYGEGVITEDEIQELGDKIIKADQERNGGTIGMSNETFLEEMYHRLVERYGPPTLNVRKETCNG